jgi:hypothetical protein
VSFQLATSASSPTFFADMPARTPAWQGVLGMSSSLEVKVFYPT